METPKHQFDTWICTSPVDNSAPSATVFVVTLPIRTVRAVPSSEALDMGRNRLRLPSVPAGLKPFADGIRNMPPFGLPKREGQHERTSRNTGGVASSQVDPHQGGIGAHAQQHGRWRDRSPLRLPERMDSPVPLAFVRPPAATREVRLNGFPGALAEVLRHRVVGARRRVPGRGAQGMFGAAKVVQPAYPLSYNGAGEGWRTPPLRSPRSSRSRGGRGRGLRPSSPVPVRRDA